MAKSLRSKWKRKCRAIKRERYGKKELERLKKTLGIDEASKNKKDIDMDDVSKTVNVVKIKTTNRPIDENEMETNENARVFNQKTLRDQHGAYPVWVHPRKIVKKSKKSRKTGGGKGRQRRTSAKKP